MEAREQPAQARGPSGSTCKPPRLSRCTVNRKSEPAIPPGKPPDAHGAFLSLVLTVRAPTARIAPKISWGEQCLVIQAEIPALFARPASAPASRTLIIKIRLSGRRRLIFLAA